MLIEPHKSFIMKRRLLTLAVILTATFGLNAQIQNYAVGDDVADFTVVDIEGNSHTLSDYTSAGKWVVLDFFFVDCPPCQQTVGFFNELHEKYGCNEGDLVCISINTGQDDDAYVASFESTYGGSFSHSPAVSGDGGSAAVDTDFNPSQYPTYCLVGADMKMKNTDIWPIASVNDFENAITAAGHTPQVMSCGSVSSIEENALLNAIAVFPNPAAASATVSVSLEATTDVTVEVFNLVGALVSTEVYSGVSGENNFTVNTSALENGQYILNVSLGDNVARTQVNLNVLK